MKYYTMRDNAIVEITEAEYEELVRQSELAKELQEKCNEQEL